MKTDTRRNLARGVFAVALASLMTGPRVLAAETVTVFAAASMKEALDAIGRDYEARTGVKVKIAYAATSAMARQVEQGAPADVFVSADEQWMDYLAARRLIVAASRRDIAANRLVLIAPAGSSTRLRIGRGMPLGAALGTGRLALAGQDVPAGRYGRAALTALGAWDGAAARVVEAENVRVALQYVARGEAALGVVYETDARVEPGVRIVGAFPANTHPPIVYPAALVAGSKSAGAAAFLRHLSGAQAQATLRRHGFAAPPRR